MRHPENALGIPQIDFFQGFQPLELSWPHLNVLPDRTWLASIMRDQSAMMSALAPKSINVLADEIRKQTVWYDQFLEIATASGREFRGQIERMHAEITGSLIGPDYGSLFGRSGYDEVARIVEATQGFHSPSSSAVMATALGGLRDLIEVISPTVRGALSNPIAESARGLLEASRILAGSADSITRDAVERSILLTDAEIRTGSRMLVSFGKAPSQVATEAPQRALLVPRRQRQDLRRLRLSIAEMTLEELLSSIPTGQPVLLARELLGVMVEIDEALTLTARPLIFKRTARTMRVFAELPFVVTTCRSAFADLVDDMYWLLYEAAGSDSLRFLIESGGPFKPDQCEIVFVMKRLRNFYRHDLEHGDSREIARKQAAVRGDLESRGFKELPRNAMDYRRLQNILLAEVLAFLHALQKALSN